MRSAGTRPARKLCRLRQAVAAGTAVLMLAIAGCGDGGDDLPDGARLLTEAGDEMAGVETARLRLEADADVADLPVRSVDGVVTRTGEAQGTARVEQFGQLVELDFVAVGDRFHYRVLGGWQELPMARAADLYDPSAILDPDQGVANLLHTATDARTRDRERLDGADTYRVTAELDAQALAVLLPGMSGPVTGTLWIGVDRPLLHQARFPVPGGEGAEDGTVTANLSEIDDPVSISEP